MEKKDQEHVKLVALITAALVDCEMKAGKNLDIVGRKDHAVAQAEHILTKGYHLEATLTRKDGEFHRTFSRNGVQIGAAHSNRLDETRLKAAIIALNLALDNEPEEAVVPEIEEETAVDALASTPEAYGVGTEEEPEANSVKRVTKKKATKRGRNKSKTA